MTPLTEVPESFAAGTTVKFTISDSDHPANDGWTMEFSLAGAGVLTVDAAASGADHAFTISATDSAKLPAGTQRWALQAKKAGEVEPVDRGQLVIEPNLAAAGAGDLQSSNEKLLAALDAVIAWRIGGSSGSAPKGVEAYVIDGISVTYVPLEQLQRFRTTVAYAVQRERNDGSIGRQHRVNLLGARSS